MTAYEIGNSWEKDLKKKLDGRLQPISGATWHSKLDVDDPLRGLLWSAKATLKRSFRIDHEMLSEMRRATYAPGGSRDRMPVLAVRTADDETATMFLEDLLMVFEELIELREHYDRHLEVRFGYQSEQESRKHAEKAERKSELAREAE